MMKWYHWTIMLTGSFIIGWNINFFKDWKGMPLAFGLGFIWAVFYDLFILELF